MKPSWVEYMWWIVITCLVLVILWGFYGFIRQTIQNQEFKAQCERMNGVLVQGNLCMRKDLFVTPDRS